MLLRVVVIVALVYSSIAAVAIPSPLRARAPVVCGNVSNVGKVAIWRASNNTLLGYITRKFNIHNMYTAGTLAVTGLNVQLPEDLTENVLFEMTALSGPSSAFPLVGGAGHPSYYDFTPWRLGFVHLSGTAHTAANSPPSLSAGNVIGVGQGYPTESTIWRINCTTLAITATWVSSDYNAAQTFVFYDPKVNYLGLVGYFDLFTAKFPTEGAYLVTFTYVPNV